MIRTLRTHMRVLAAGAAAFITTTCGVEPSGPRVDINAPDAAAVAGARVARVIEPGELGFSHPAGLAYSPKVGMLLVVPRPPDASPGQETDVELISVGGDRVGAVRIAAAVTDPVNIAFDDKAGRFLMLEPGSNRLFEVGVRLDGSLDPQTLRSSTTLSVSLTQPQGLTVDPTTGRLFILDAAGPQILRVTPHARLGFESPTVSAIDLAGKGMSNPRGIAFDPKSGRLHVLSPTTRALFELTENGRLIATRDLSAFEFYNPRGMSFGPSGDATDDPTATSLYIADAGTGRSFVPGRQGGFAETGHITELSLVAQSASGGGPSGFAAPLGVAAADVVVASLVRTVLTSTFSPPIPDPSGIDFIASRGSLLISDGEVDEMAIFADANLFELNLAGNLVGTANIRSFTNEPTGVASDPDTRRVFISDDVTHEIYVVTPGPDGAYGTADDGVTSFDTQVFGSDPEGVTYDVVQDVLFIADGLDAQVYRVSPGSNGIFDGVAPAGDDQVTSWDTQVHGLNDPEGITFDTETGGLYVVGKPANLVFHFSTTGTLLRTINISAAGALKPAGLAYVPSTVNADGSRRLWIVDRGVDNDTDPNENDGKAYEFILPVLPGNSLPTVTITAPAHGTQSFQGSPVTFTGTATDPESGNLTAELQWTSSRDGAIGSGGSFTISTLSVGTHTITASVTDGGGLQGFASITLFVTGSGASTIEVRVSASSDDAEEAVSGAAMNLLSTDLDLISDGFNQLVGMRFNALSIPPAATITNAYLQFTVDETGSNAASLAIQGQATAYAPTFSMATGNISVRPRTVSSVSWTPAAWTTIGAAGLAQRTPNIASVIQEIVNGSGWSAGNSLALIVTGTGKRTAEAWDGIPAAAPLLHVEYMVSAPNSAPTASNVSITGTPQVGQVLAGSYTYGDVDGDAEGTSTYRWLRAGTPISGAAAQTYTLVAADQGALIAFEVTPVAASGASPGSAVASPAVGPVGSTNTVPTASNVSITGTPVVGQVLTGQYTYSDADGDAEGNSTYRWLRGGTPISGAAAQTYTLMAADQGAMIAFEVTPVAATGVSPGTAVQSAAVGPVTAANVAPTASNVSITGTSVVGQVLTGQYTYSDADGDAEGNSTYRWLRGGTPISGAAAQTYTLVAADQGALIAFEVTPVAATGVSPGTAVQSAVVGPVTANNVAPTASNLSITGTVIVGSVLTGQYSYADADGDAEGTSTYRWLRAGVAITGATARTYTLVAADQGTLIRFEVTPVAATGASPGAVVTSPAVGPVAANAAPTASNVSITGNPVAGHVLTGNYTYADAEGDAEGTSTYRWLRNGSSISGATGRTYTLLAADAGAQITFRVTPVAAVGTTPGAAVTSPPVGPVTVEPLVVSAIQPNTMATGTTISVTITGSGFIPKAKVTFVNGSGGPTPRASNVVVVNSTTITATVKVNRESAGPARVWDVRVTNSNGVQASLAGGLTIIR